MAEGRAQLLVKGLKSMWRMAPGILRSTLGGAVHRIILDDDVEVSRAFVQSAWLHQQPHPSGTSDVKCTATAASKANMWRLGMPHRAIISAASDASKPRDPLPSQRLSLWCAGSSVLG